MPSVGPLLLSPRLDAKPWGGRQLERFGFTLPAGALIGEAVITAAEAVIVNGKHAGRTLGGVVEVDPAGAIGERGLALTGGRPLFPLLIKLIDANEDLSIQVHPNDINAPAGSLGKTEAWHVLDARPGSVLYLGFEDDVDLDEVKRLVRGGASISHLMRRVPAHPGQTILVPAGSVHALGAGVLVYEIQQPSAITYRLDDWGRVDAVGRSRDLHIDESLAVLDATSRPRPLAPQTIPSEIGTRSRLVRCSYFAAERIELSAMGELQLDGAGAPQVFTCASGRAVVTADSISEEIGPGETAALLACAGITTISAQKDGVLLRGWIDPES